MQIGNFSFEYKFLISVITSLLTAIIFSSPLLNIFVRFFISNIYFYLPKIALKVFCLITMRAGIYPAIIVVMSKTPARKSEEGIVATNIPSEKGKFIG